MSGSLEHSPAEVIRNLLVAKGAGTMPTASGSWPIYHSLEPDLPDKVITVYNETGIKQGRTQIDGEVQEKHGIQIRVRSSNERNGYKKARQLADLVDKQVRQDLITLANVETAGNSTYRVVCISRVGDVISLGTELSATKRHLFTLNCLVPMRQVS